MNPLWLDQLQPASFRGVRFHVDTIEHHAGDNVVLREYPFQDLPTVFRMGEGAEEIKLAAYVVGSDYTAQRDALRQVLTGSGELVHPTAGTLRVFVAGKFTIKEAPTAEGGIARFDLVFVRAEVRRYPVGVTNTPEQAEQAAQAAEAASVDSFAATFDVASVPGWAADRALARLTETVTTVWDTVKAFAAAKDDFSNALIGDYQQLRDSLASLVRQPRALAQGMDRLFAVPADLAPDQARSLAAGYASLFDLGPRLGNRAFEVRVVPPVGGGLVMFGAGSAVAQALPSPARTQLAGLTGALDQLTETLATSAWARAVARVELAGYDDALALRNQVNTQCTRLLLRASTTLNTTAAYDNLPGSPWHDAVLAVLRTSLGDLQTRGRVLARTSSYTPTGWLSIWSVSYLLYGSAQYADELLAMNPHITHPLLVPPGVALRVRQL